MDKTEDIHFPVSFSPFIKMEDSLVIIFPADAAALRHVNMETIIRGVILSDDEFGELNEGMSPEECEILAKFYYNVDYIRFTRLRQVTEKEWYYSTYIDQNTFSRIWKKDMNATVKILKLNKETLSLKDLKHYKVKSLKG